MDFEMMGSWKQTVEIWITDNQKKDLRIQELVTSLKDMIQENKKFQTALFIERESHATTAAELSILKGKVQEKNLKLEKLSKILKKTGNQLSTPRILFQSKQQNPRSYHQLPSRSKNASPSFLEKPESLLKNPEVSLHKSRDSCPEILNFMSLNLLKPMNNSTCSQYSDLSDSKSENLSRTGENFINREINEKVALSESDRPSLLQSLKAKIADLEKLLEESLQKCEDLQNKIINDTGKYEETILKLKQEIIDVQARSEQSERENLLNSKYFERKLNEKDVNYKKLLDDLEVLKKVNRSLVKELDKLKPSSQKSLKKNEVQSNDEGDLSDTSIACFSPSARSFASSPREFLKAKTTFEFDESKSDCGSTLAVKPVRNYKIILSSPQSPKSQRSESSPTRINI